MGKWMKKHPILFASEGNDNCCQIKKKQKNNANTLFKRHRLQQLEALIITNKKY
jgi:hypothetical protein